MNIILGVKSITKIYNHHTKNEFETLHGTSLEVHEGDLICIMGPSGSGKSTLINNLSAIDTPIKGKVKINDIDIYNTLESQTGKFRYENLRFIFQSFNSIDIPTPKENIALPLALSNMLKEEIGIRMQQTAERLELMDVLDKCPVECPGEQYQRCVVARALINKSKLIVADEPTGSLDSKDSHTLFTILKGLNEHKKATIPMVAHDAMITNYSGRLLHPQDDCIEKDLERANMDQKEYLYKTAQISSRESMELLSS